MEAEEEERHKGLLTPKKTFHKVFFHQKVLQDQCYYN
jgi:hypothetical protein